jgi:hypothetical protein
MPHNDEEAPTAERIMAAKTMRNTLITPPLTQYGNDVKRQFMIL